MIFSLKYYMLSILQSFSSIHSLNHLCIHPGILNLPAVALGIITGGFVLKRFKLGVIGAARVAFAASVGSLCLLAIQVFISCDNAEVAGLTVSYQGWVTCKPSFHTKIEVVIVWVHCRASYDSAFVLMLLFVIWLHGENVFLKPNYGQCLQLKCWSSWKWMYSFVSFHVRVHQGYSSVLWPADFAVTVQHGLLLLNEALGPSMRLQRNDVCLTLPGWLPDLHRHWQRNGKTACNSIYVFIIYLHYSN